MKAIRYVLVVTFLALSICAGIYTSCTKDTCKSVTCINGGNCGGGNCTCPNGIGGLNCEIIYRKQYANTYKGGGTSDSGKTYIDNTFSFAIGNDTSYTKMQLSWNTGTKVINMPVNLISFTPDGAAFTINSTTVDTFTYNGGGTVNKATASLTLTETHPNSTPVHIFLNNFSKQ